MAAAALALTTAWTEPPFLTADAALLWHAVPAFLAVGGGGPVTLFRPTDPAFADSFRLFGVPAGHACRLEAGLSDFKGPDWLITFVGKSYLGIPRYRLQDAGNPTAFLVAPAADTVNGSATLATIRASDDADVQRTSWYIVPRAPDPARGWDQIGRANV